MGFVYGDKGMCRMSQILDKLITEDDFNTVLQIPWTLVLKF